MTLCVFTGAHCCCQPDDGIPCPDIPRYVATDLPDIMQPSPIGAWVRWSDVEAVILGPIRRSYQREREAADGGPQANTTTMPKHE